MPVSHSSFYDQNTLPSPHSLLIMPQITNPPSTDSLSRPDTPSSTSLASSSIPIPQLIWCSIHSQCSEWITNKSTNDYWLIGGTSGCVSNATLRVCGWTSRIGGECMSIAGLLPKERDTDLSYVARETLNINTPHEEQTRLIWFYYSA